MCVLLVWIFSNVHLVGCHEKFQQNTDQVHIHYNQIDWFGDTSHKRFITPQGWDKVTVIFKQFSHLFPCMKIVVLWLKFHLNVFPRALVQKMAWCPTGNKPLLDQWWPSLTMHMSQVMKVRLSCYLVLLSNDASGGPNEGENQWHWKVSHGIASSYGTYTDFVDDIHTANMVKYFLINHRYWKNICIFILAI